MLSQDLIEKARAAKAADGVTVNSLGLVYFTDAAEVEPVNDENMVLRFTVSTEVLNRNGHLVRQDGWKLDNYRANPVVPWAHNYDVPVVGRGLEVGVVDATLKATIQFAPTDFARELYKLYRGSFMRGCSPGYDPIKSRLLTESGPDGHPVYKGIEFIEQDLLEISPVVVGANASALSNAVKNRIISSNFADELLVAARLAGQAQAPPSAAAGATPAPAPEGPPAELMARLDVVHFGIRAAQTSRTLREAGAR